ncbi:MAG: NTP transferase domain-containing protein [Peptococcaceae bacterium]|nr:NTP transferase domain-containing protein [Peptococcaceae bacterium]
MNINNLLIDEDNSVLEAMKLLDKTAKQVIFIAPENKLKAVITDGDIRRHILRGGSLEEPVHKIANYSPKFIPENQKNKAQDFLKKYCIRALPIVNEERKIVSLVFADDLEITNKKNIINAPVVIMAGGLGTRLHPYTKVLPKPLIPIGDLPITEHIINRFKGFGCTEFYLILNHKKNMIKSYFNDLDKDYDLKYVDELVPLGTGGGLSLLKGKVNSTFFFSNCDILIDADYHDIYKFHKKQGNVITMICAFKHITIPYGIVNLDNQGRIHSMIEKPEYAFLTNTGMYIVEPRVIEELDPDISVSFPEIFDKYRLSEQKVGIYPINEQCWMDMGQIEELEEMKKRLEV